MNTYLVKNIAISDATAYTIGRNQRYKAGVRKKPGKGEKHKGWYPTNVVKTEGTSQRIVFEVKGLFDERFSLR